MATLYVLIIKHGFNYGNLKKHDLYNNYVLKNKLGINENGARKIDWLNIFKN